MKFGLMVGEGSGATPDLSALIERAKKAESLGLDTAWIAEINHDALVAAAAAGVATERIELGTAVIRTYTRHPHGMAISAATTQQACGGRFALGIGLSHKIVIENMLGLSYDKPAKHTEEYLELLVPMLRGETVKHRGEHYSVHAEGPTYTEAPQVLVAALGPVMLRVAGRHSDGTITWATGPKTLEQHIVPVLNGAAEEAGKPAPRVVAGFPICITDKVDETRALAAEVFAIYATLPSYKAMLDREGFSGVESLALIGSESQVEAQIERLRDLGVTDFCGFPFGDGGFDRPAEFLASLSM